jgi:hypothetical protein
MKSLPRVIAACTALFLALFLWALRPSLHSARAPTLMDQCPFLRGVVEPIIVVNAMSFDDGGSKGLRFADSRGVQKDVCLENTLGGQRNVVLNSFVPRGDRGQRVPIAGVEERALLGLLERWARQDHDAMELERLYELYERGQIDLIAFWDGLPAACRLKETAVSILRELRARN